MKNLFKKISDNKTYILPWVILLTAVAALALSLSYAYFDLAVDSETESSLQITATNLDITLSATKVTVSNMMPIYDDYYSTQASKFDFTASNSSRKLDGCSDIALNFTKIPNELKNADIKYRLVNNTTGGYATGNFSEIDNNNSLVLMNNNNVPRGATQSFSLYIWASFSETENQTYLLGKNFKAKLVVTTYGGTCGSVTNLIASSGAQTYTVQKTGYYQIELSGAGSTIAGDYTSGEILLEEGEILYFYVGSNSGSSDVRCFANELGKCVANTSNSGATNVAGLKARIMYAGGNKSTATNLLGNPGSAFISGYAGANAPIYLEQPSDERIYSDSPLHYTGKFFLNGEMIPKKNTGTASARISFIGEPTGGLQKVANVRYIKDCMAGNSANGRNAWVEIQAIKDGTNVALHKPITSDGVFDTAGTGTGTLSTIVDGNVSTSVYIRSSTTDYSTQCVTIDLGKPQDLDEIAVWHYYSGGRTYNNNITYVSSNNTTWKAVMASEEVETNLGKRYRPYVDGTIKTKNLFKNGYGELLSNANFTSLTYNDGYFTRTSSTSAAIFSNEYIPVDTSKTYKMKAQAKASNTTAKHYFGYACYDEDKNLIAPVYVLYIAGSLTTLKQDLNPGDTVVYLTNADGFNVTSSSATYQRGFIFWNYKDYEPLTYSRNHYGDLYEYTGVNKENDTITLKTGWTRSSIPAGTPLSQSNSGSYYDYLLGSNISFNEGWTTYSGTINGVTNYHMINPTHFRAGTKYIRFMVYDNYNNTASTTTYYKNIELIEQ